ncbi:MAG TPA: hypothetical protein VI757_09500 [Bacteroidia bacterium]|nr:hypothetical protein [Bacteroidia bacterium]
MMPGEAEALLCLHSHPDFTQYDAPVAFGTPAGLAFGVHWRLVLLLHSSFFMLSRYFQLIC